MKNGHVGFSNQAGRHDHAGPNNVEYPHTVLNRSLPYRKSTLTNKSPHA
jgi:hypothetical protein